MKNRVYPWVGLAAIMLLVGLAWVRVAQADGGPGGETQVLVVQGYQVTLTFTRPAQVGANPVQVQVSDAHGQPVAHAEVGVSLVADESAHTDTGHGDSGHDEAEASADTHTDADTDTHSDTNAHTDTDADTHRDTDTHSDTDAHGDAVALTHLTEATHGEYAGEIGLPQAGAWLVRVHLMLDDTPLMVDFPITVAPTQNGLGILAGFLAANVGILGIAAVLRARKPAKAPQP